MKRADAGRISAIAACMLLVGRAHAFALNASLDVSQYAHTAWKVSEGLSRGTIRTIAQTLDGYLWLGSEFGLLRFDGVRAVAWEPPPGEHLPNSDIRSLQGARDGRLWIGTFSGLASWKDGKLVHYPDLDGQVIESLLEDREGTIWVAGWAPSLGRLCRIQADRTECYGADGRFGAGVTPLHEDRRGNLWVGAMTGLWRWKPGLPTRYPVPDPADRIYALAESDDGGILVARRSGISELRNGKLAAVPVAVVRSFQTHRMLRDRHGALWIGAMADRGLLHRHDDGRTDRFTAADGLSGDSVNAFFEDREGNVWVATLDGLDRFRDFAIPTFSVRQGLSSRGIASVLSAHDGSLWFGTSEGLDRWHEGQFTVYRNRRRDGVPGGTAREIVDRELPDTEAESLFEDDQKRLWVGTQSGVAVLETNRFVRIASVPNGVVYGFAGDHAGNVWISHQDGLFHLFEDRVVEHFSWARLGRREPASALLHDPVQAGLWLGFRDGGVAYFRDGQLRVSYAGAEGLAAGMVRSFYRDGHGTLWASADGGASRIADQRVVTLTSQNGLPCSTVHWIMEDDNQSVWLYLACGLVRVSRSDLDSWALHPQQTIQTTVFDGTDGVSSHRFTSYNALVAKSADGRLWFLRVGGVSLVDPRRIRRNDLAPPVYVERIVADHTTFAAAQDLRLPPLVRDLQIDYTALSLVAPEKNRFRIKLEGRDRDWQDVGTRRQAFYTDLGPRAYRFRVLASNNSGVWNETGASLDFSIAPAYYQTRWFAALVVFLTATLLWAAYRLRVAQLARQFNRTLDARLSERARIARDLHDTLLQSFQGALLRFQSVATVIRTRPDEASDRLERALDQAEAAIAEGRNAVQGLRTSTTTMNDLANGIAAVGAELTGDPTAVNPPIVDVRVDSPSRDLNPLVRDEAYRIAAEALRNAVRHACSRRVTVTLSYEPRQFRLTVHDDGKGLDEETMAQQQTPGHFGLPGMRERAAIIKGRFHVRSVTGTGTEIEVIVPAAIAYAATVRDTSWRRPGRR